MFVFVPVTGIRTQLTKVKTEARFAARDPWNQNRPGDFSLDSYLVTLRGVKSVPEGAQDGGWQGDFHRALRCEADGVTRFLPESLVELWLGKQVSMEALPGLLKQIEPNLRKSDYEPMLHSLSMKIFGIFETVLCAGLVIIAMIGVVLGHAPWWLGAAVVAGTASVCWLFLYLVYFGKIFRRKRQMRWLVEHNRAGNAATGELMVSAMTPPPMTPPPMTPPPLLLPPRTPIISPQLMPLQTLISEPQPIGPKTAESNGFRFESDMTVPKVMEPAMEPRLKKAFPELTWEDEAENWDKVRIEGTSRDAPRHVVVSIVRKESPGTFKLRIAVNARDQAEAVKSVRETIERIKRALLGWSQFHLPSFKPRPPAGIDMDQEEVIDLMFPLESGQVKVRGGNAIIVISRILLEALSLHGEILDSRAMNPEAYAGSDGEESRMARMRGARARFILGKGVTTGSGEDLEVEMDLVREGHYLIGELLELGLAQVVCYRAGAPLMSPSRIKVHNFGSRLAPTVGFGYISYSAADGEAAFAGEFLRLDWWRS